MLRVISILILNALYLGLTAQQRHIDSLKKLIAHEKSDSVVLRLYVQLSTDCDETEIPQYALKAVDLSQKLLQDQHLSQNFKTLFLNHLGSAYNDLGYYHRLKGETPLALSYYQKALSLKEQTKDSAEIALILNNIASVYYKQGKILETLKFYNKCLFILQNIKDKTNLPTTLYNIAGIYNELGLKDKTINYYKEALRISREVNNKRGEVRALIGLGSTYRKKGALDSALYFYYHGLDVEEKLGDKDFIPHALFGIATTYNDKGNIDSAIAIHLKSLKVLEYINDKQNLSATYVALGKIYLALKDYRKAESFALKSHTINEELGYPKDLRNSAHLLYQCYKAQNNISKAMPMLELYMKMRDSIINIETRYASIKSELQYEFDRKSIADSIKNLNEKNTIKSKIALQNAELKQAKTIRWVLIIGLLLGATIFIILYNRYRLTQQQQKIIQSQQQITQQQKLQIEQKNKLITQSISYAKRIQDAFIKSETTLKESGLEYFILNMPKDIVSGDFVWAKKIKSKLYFAVADCTGHGVPGAFMSLVSYNLLEQAINVYGCYEPKDILKNVTVNLQKALLSEDGSRSYEGVEMLLCCLDLKTHLLQYTGSRQRLFHLRNGLVKEYRVDSIEIGANDADKNFRQFELSLEKNDVIYLLTDGYADQKGGPNKAKLYYDPLKEYLGSNPSDTLTNKKKHLQKQLENWKGTEEQVDDILVFGIKV